MFSFRHAQVQVRPPFPSVHNHPTYMGTRRTLHILAWSFGVAWGILAAQTIWICEKEPVWKVGGILYIFNTCTLTAVSQIKAEPRCPLGLTVAIAQLISTAPLRSQYTASSFLWHLDSKSFPERRRLLIVFSSSVVTTTTSLIHAYYLLRVGGLVDIFAALIEVRAHLYLLVHPRFVLTAS